MSAPTEAALQTHVSSRAPSLLLQAMFSVAIVLGVQYLLRAARDHAFAVVLAILGFGGVFAVRWLASQRPHVVRAHASGLSFTYPPLVPLRPGVERFFPYAQLRSVRRDEDMDGRAAFVLELHGHPPVRLSSPSSTDGSSLEALVKAVVEQAALAASRREAA